LKAYLSTAEQSLATHVALELMDRRRLRSADDVEGDGLMRVATEAFDLEVAKPAFKASPIAGDGGAGPRKPSMRAFQASHARRSAFFRAVAACSVSL
jgi:hypothetical protein